jgi:hypothetical protein
MKWQVLTIPFGVLLGGVQGVQPHCDPVYLDLLSDTVKILK